MHILLSVISRSQVETIMCKYLHMLEWNHMLPKDWAGFDNAPPLGWPSATAPPWERRSEKMPNKCPGGDEQAWNWLSHYPRSTSDFQGEREQGLYSFNIFVLSSLAGRGPGQRYYGNKYCLHFLYFNDFMVQAIINAEWWTFCLETNLGKAVLQYDNEGHNTMNMYHTQVPTEYRGQGIAGHLAKVTFCRLSSFGEINRSFYESIESHPLSVSHKSMSQILVSYSFENGTFLTDK